MYKLRLSETLKANLKKILRSKPNLKCAKHVRYNPAQGRAAIVGGCSGCERAYAAFNAYITLTEAVVKYITVAADPYESAKPRTKKVAPNKGGFLMEDGDR
jgi:hypothetical protein